MAPPPIPDTVSVTEAAERGVSAIVRAAGEGRDIVVEKRGRPVAAVIGIGRLNEIAELEADLRTAALVLARLASVQAPSADLDDVIASFGFSRADLEAELDADLAAGRD